MSQFDRGVGTYWPTVCSDPRCTTTQTCQREKHERYGNAPGENYGPRCVPLPPPVRTAEEERADVLAFLRRAASYPEWSLRADRYLDALHEMIEAGEHVGALKRERTKEKP